MQHPETMRPLFAVCINNAEYPASLERHKIYQVLPDEDAARDGDIRLDESERITFIPRPSLSTGGAGKSTPSAPRKAAETAHSPSVPW
jgi:hypothetical protein